MTKPKYLRKIEPENSVITTSGTGGFYQLRAIYTAAVKDLLVTKAKTVKEFGGHAFLAGVAYGRAYPAKRGGMSNDLAKRLWHFFEDDTVQQYDCDECMEIKGGQICKWHKKVHKFQTELKAAFASADREKGE